MADEGEQIGGYKLRKLLQTGQVSQVFEVVEPSSNRHFAMKLLLPEATDRPEVRKNLFHEAEVGIKLRHDNIIRIVKIDRSQDAPHFIMEFFPSGSMRNRILRKEAAFMKENAMKIFRQMATGLAYMHANGWVHCDVKADNMLVNQLGDLRIIDFAISKKIVTGISRWFSRKAKVAQGTPSFMSPEQIRGGWLDGRADIYSLGATMYELLTFRPPFRGNNMQALLEKHIKDKVESPQIHNKELTDEISAMILKMLAKKPEDRPQNCHDILISLRKMRVFKTDPYPEEMM
jgi:eukaryotic-like serine/threonine-protein kinase